MPYLNVNDLSAPEIRTLLPGLDGITVSIADKLAEYAAERIDNDLPAFDNQLELMDRLTEFGLRSRYRESVERLLQVEPAGIPPYSPFFVDFVLDPDNFIEFDREHPVPDEPFIAPAGQPPRIFGEEISTNNRPLVLVPGIMASQLFVRENGYKVKKWPPIGLNGIDIFKELEDPIREGRLLPGVETVFDSYSNLLTNLAAVGFHQNLNLLVFNYDWTKSNLISGKLLAAAIQAFLDQFNQLFGTSFDKVDVICHSMGGLVTRSAIINDAAPVRRTVYIATPHYGSPKAYFALHSGIEITGLLTEVAFFLFKIFTDREDYASLDEGLNRLATLCQSVYELLPNDFYLNNVPMLRVESAGGTERYIKGTRQTYFKNKWQLGIGQHSNAQRGIDFTEALGPTPPGEHLLILCPDLDTDDEIEFNIDVIGDDEFEDPESSVRQGDETVPTYSACAAAGNSRHVFVRNKAHLELPNVRQSFVAMKRYLGF